MNIDIFSFFQTIYIYIKYKGKLKRFRFPQTSINMYTVEKTLRNYGVLVYGRKIHNNKDRSFLVLEKQAKWAEQLCFRAGFPKLGVDYDVNRKYLDNNLGLPKKQWEKSGRKGDVFYDFAEVLSILSKGKNDS